MNKYFRKTLPYLIGFAVMAAFNIVFMKLSAASYHDFSPMFQSLFTPGMFGSLMGLLGFSISLPLCYICIDILEKKILQTGHQSA